MTQVLVCGSRHFKDPFRASLAIDLRLSQLEPCVILHGGALGADMMANAQAALHGHVTRIFLPDYDTHGKRAPLIRNLEMLAQRPDLVLAFWDQESRGTLHTITEAQKRQIPVEIIVLK